jgi:hypothetical protein
MLGERKVYTNLPCNILLLPFGSIHLSLELAKSELVLIDIRICDRLHTHVIHESFTSVDALTLMES